MSPTSRSVLVIFAGLIIVLAAELRVTRAESHEDGARAR